MAAIQNKVIHRFIRDVSEYEKGGLYYNRVIPLDTQAYAFYNDDDFEKHGKTGLYYVLGDGNHTYAEIRAGKGSIPSAQEYPVFTQGVFDEKIDTLIAGVNVVISGDGPVRKISVPGVAVPDRFTSQQELPDDLAIGDELKNLNGLQALAVTPPASLKENDIVIFASGHQVLVTFVDPTEALFDGVIIYAPVADKEISFANLKGEPSDNAALSVALDDKLEKQNVPNTLYGIDENGNQTVFHFLDVGIPDAPKDNKEYVRSNGEWIPLNNSAVINDFESSYSSTYSSAKIDTDLTKLKGMIADLAVLNVEVLEDLPEVGKTKVLYFIPSKISADKNIYEEYMWVNNTWELIGNTALDLTDYITTSELNAAITAEQNRAIKAEHLLTTNLDSAVVRVANLEIGLETKQNKLTAGNNITIENDVISATSAIVTVNNVGPDENGNVLLTKDDLQLENVDNTSDLDKPISKATLFVLDSLNEKIDTKQDILEAGENIVIEGNTISAANIVTPYEFLTGKPLINDVELVGNKSLDELGIQPAGDYATNTDLNTKADKGSSLEEYGILDAYTKTETDELLNTKADKATTLHGYGINDAYTKLWVDTHFVNIERYNADVDRNNALLANLDEIKASKDELNSGLSKKQDTLIAGEHISIKENVISANYLYTDLTDKPSINNVVLEGNKTSEDLGLQATLKAGNGIILENDVISVVNNIDSYDDLIDKPYVNGTELKGALTLDDLGIQQKGEYVSANELKAETERALEAEELLNNSVTSISRNVGYVTQAISYLESEKQDRLIPGYGIRITGNVISVDLSDKEESEITPDYDESGYDESNYDDSGYDESGYIPINPGVGYVTRVEYEAKCNEYEDKIAALEQRLDRMVKLVTSAGFMIVGVDEAIDF